MFSSSVMLCKWISLHAPAREERLKYGDVKAVAGKLPCAGDTGGARADDGHAPAVLGGDLRGAGQLGLVAQEALQLTDGYGLAPLAAYADALALALLWADATADGR